MNLQAALAVHRLVAIVRGGDADASLRTVLTLAEEGIELVEVSLTGKDALTVIERAREALGPDRPLGAGTVLTADDARAAHDAGADFAVTPGLGDGVRAARHLGMPVLAGVMTPTDIIAARALGAEALKIFPAAQAAWSGVCESPARPVPARDVRPGRRCRRGGRPGSSGGRGNGCRRRLTPHRRRRGRGSLTALRERARAFRAVVRETA